MEGARLAPADALAALCRRHGVRRLALFGSILRDDFGPQSDVDVLVEFWPGRTPGLEFFALQDELATLFGRPVDLLTRASVEGSPNWIRRRSILESAVTIYDEVGERAPA